MNRSLAALLLTMLLAAPALAQNAMPNLNQMLDAAGQDKSLADVKTTLEATAKAMGSFAEITPEQEHYLGRSVAAVILSQYKPLRDEAAHAYLNSLGQTLALASDRPETFGGYHFLILDSDDVFALSAPGGLIFLSRGMIRSCPSEDALAAVLAHEVSHVVAKHGLKAIKESRLTKTLSKMLLDGARAETDADVAMLLDAFEGSVLDVYATLTDSGYSRELESQADAGAVELLRRVGYDPNGLVEALLAMEENFKPGAKDFGRTHPSPAERYQALGLRFEPVSAPAPRQARFLKAMTAIRQ